MVVLSFLVAWISYLCCILLAAQGHWICAAALSAAIIIYVSSQAKHHV